MKNALIVIDVQSGDITLDPALSLSDYITEYKTRNANAKVQKIIDDLGLNGSLLREMLARKYSRDNVDLAKLNALKDSVDKGKAQAFFEETRAIYLNKKIDAFLRRFIVEKT